MSCGHQTAGSIKLSVVIETDDYTYTRAESYLVSFRYKYVDGSLKRAVSVVKIAAVDNAEAGVGVITDGTIYNNIC